MSLYSFARCHVALFIVCRIIPIQSKAKRRASTNHSFQLPNTTPRRARRSQRASLRTSRKSATYLSYDLKTGHKLTPTPQQHQPTFVPYRNYIPTQEELEIQRKYNPKMILTDPHSPSPAAAAAACGRDRGNAGVEQMPVTPLSAEPSTGGFDESVRGSQFGRGGDGTSLEFVTDPMDLFNAHIHDMGGDALLPLLQGDGPFHIPDHLTHHTLHPPPPAPLHLSVPPPPSTLIHPTYTLPDLPHYQPHLPSPISPTDPTSSTLTAKQRLIIEGALGMVPVPPSRDPTPAPPPRSGGVRRAQTRERRTVKAAVE
ncbi:hypothetical protein HDU67_006230, partial [Dinochytrium kinnereticum]